MPKLVLASASQRRLDLLRQINIEPSFVVAANIDEGELKREKPRQYAARVALSKAKEVAKNHQDKLVLAADTIVISANKILHKPETDEQVLKCLNLLSGKSHRVVTAFSLINQDKIISKLVETRVVFKRLTSSEINDYVTSKEGIGKAGGYSIQGYAGSFVINIFGSYTNIVGLPLYEVRNVLISNNLDKENME